jgi:hypothetical protein
MLLVMNPSPMENTILFGGAILVVEIHLQLFM